MDRPTDHPVVRRSDDLAAALTLARAARLEVDESPSPPLAMWGAFHGERMVGTVSLDDYKGLTVVGRIAVDESCRGRGLGGRLLAALEDEARERGETTLWVTARAPGFFAAMGYSVVETGEEHDLLLSECAQCEQYGTECRPQALRKMLGG
jgi:N-acetylglutamate synthase-like GNAT family acetyltransferase